MNNKILRVTNNLHTALHHLRQHDQDRILWIDAICINQNNVRERSDQVSRIGDIFRYAKRVIVWLGKATIEVDFLMRWLKQLRELNVGVYSIEEAAKDESLRTGLRILL